MDFIIYFLHLCNQNGKYFKKGGSLVCYVGSEFWHRIWLVTKFMVTIFQRSLSFCTKLAKILKIVLWIRVDVTIVPRRPLNEAKNE